MESKWNASEIQPRNTTILKNDHEILLQTEIEGNQSRPIVFILLGFGNLHELRFVLFTLFLIIYTLSILGNLLIVFLVAVEQHLHTPMYFFLMNLSSLEICYISTILPRMLASFLNGNRSISIQACITQYYFFGFLATTECYLLTTMSYDRYLAICKPLHYTSIMNSRICFHLALISWTCGLITSTIIICFLTKLNFCGPNIIDHFFCDIYPVVNLSCSNTYLTKLVTFILACMGSGPPFLLTLTSYILIIHTILSIKSKAAQKKAFSTCSSHLIVVIIFYGSLILVYVVPETETLKGLHKTFSLFYTVLTPILNPLIYSLRNREVKTALFRSFRKLSNAVA